MALFICCSCAKEPLDPSIPYGLLIKCRDFLAFCVFLADQEKPYYNHIAQRYYYALLSLASIPFQWRKGHGHSYTVFSKHDDVWGMMPKDIRSLYGKRLKSLRTRCDYYHDVTARDNDGFKKDLKQILFEGDEGFLELKGVVKTEYKKFFSSVDQENLIGVEDCDCLFEEIESLNEELKQRI